MYRKVKFIVRTRGFRALIRGISRILLRTVYVQVLNKRYVRIKVFNFKLWVDLFDEGISRTLWLYGERELDRDEGVEQVAGEVAADPAADAHREEHQGHDERPLERRVAEDVAGEGGESEFGDDAGTAGGKKTCL